MDLNLLENYLNQIYAGQLFIPSYKVNELETKKYPLKVSKEIINDLDNLFLSELPTEFDKELSHITVYESDNNIKLKITWT